MGTDSTGDKRKWVLVKDDLQRLLKLTCSCKLQVSGDILMDGAAFLAGSHKTVRKGHRLLDLSGRKGLYRLYMVLVVLHSFYQCSGFVPVHTFKCSNVLARKDLSDLLQPLITAGL